MRDDLIMGKPGQASVARAIAGASATTYYAQDGQAVSVELSPGYAPRATPEAVQAYVNLIGSRAHGPELKRLTMVIATLSEVQNRYCSPRALACYVPKYQVMIVPGEQTPSDEVPVEYVLTHEYGHHIAANRSNDPWPAIAWGPKAWASHEAVCAGVAERVYFPGDQGENYLRNPGENWAEAYAQFHYRGQFRWGFDPSFAPDDPAFARDPARRRPASAQPGGAALREADGSPDVEALPGHHQPGRPDKARAARAPARQLRPADRRRRLDRLAVQAPRQPRHPAGHGVPGAPVRGPRGAPVGLGSLQRAGPDPGLAP
jgi:hypothetical protein